MWGWVTGPHPKDKRGQNETIQPKGLLDFAGAAIGAGAEGIMNLMDQLKIQAMYTSGAFAKPDLDLTREGIAAMDKAELVEMLEAHGVTPDKRKGQAALADDLIAVVFVDGL